MRLHPQGSVDAWVFSRCWRIFQPLAAPQEPKGTEQMFPLHRFFGGDQRCFKTPMAGAVDRSLGNCTFPARHGIEVDAPTNPKIKDALSSSNLQLGVYTRKSGQKNDD